MNSGWLALASLLPLAGGPLPPAHETMTVSLCEDGSIEIPVGRSDEEVPRQCSDKGCHASCSRRKSSATWQPH